MGSKQNKVQPQTSQAAHRKPNYITETQETPLNPLNSWLLLKVIIRDIIKADKTLLISDKAYSKIKALNGKKRGALQ